MCLHLGSSLKFSDIRFPLWLIFSVQLIVKLRIVFLNPASAIFFFRAWRMGKKDVEIWVSLCKQRAEKF